MYYPSQDSRNMAVLMFVLSIFFWIIPALILYLVKKDDAFVYENAVELLNFGLTMFVANMILMFIPVIGWLAMLGVGLAALVFLIMGALKVREGEVYVFPFAFRLIKQD